MSVRVRFSLRRILANTLLATGIGFLGFVAYSYISSSTYQYFESRRFDQELARTSSATSTAPGVSTPRHVTNHTLGTGSTIGRLTIPKLKLAVLVSEGVDDDTLKRSVGHIPGTALPGEVGNAGFAGHRDTFLRSLKKLERKDEIELTTLRGTYQYVIDEMEIVDPSNVSVLAPTSEKMLTIVTCYPFSYIGPAPRRFIVRAHQVEQISKSLPADRKFPPARAESSHPE
jgi:sortase A